MLTMAPPPRSFMRRAAARATMKVPTTLTSRILRKRATGVSSAWMSAAIPAELTTPSRPPNASPAMATAFSAAVSSVTSSAEVKRRLGSPISPDRLASAFSSRSTAATFQPASSSRRTVASPMPDAAPVTSATLSFAAGFAIPLLPISAIVSRVSPFASHPRNQ